jgi:hypothetical protein
MTDSAALAGAFSLAKGGNARSSATTELGRYNLLTLNGSPVIETPPGSGSYASCQPARKVDPLSAPNIDPLFVSVGGYPGSP